MGVKMAAAGTCLHSLPHCSSSSSPQSSIMVSSVSAKRRGEGRVDRYVTCFSRIGAAGGRSPFPKLSRRRSLQDLNRNSGKSPAQFLRRAFSANLDGFLGEEEDDDDDENDWLQELGSEYQTSFGDFDEDCRNDQDSEVEMKASRLDLPVSLRIIKKKKRRWEEGFKEAGETACCSVKKAFSSMVFIVRELHSYTLQLRGELLFYENVQGILSRVQGEMNASFVWLFQQIFSCTPTFMVYVMLLLANFTVYSIGHHSNAAAFAAALPDSPAVAAEQEYCQQVQENSRFDASSVKSFSVVRSTASVGGSGGSGGKVKPVAGATDDGRSGGSCSSFKVADGVPGSGSAGVEEQQENTLWDKMVEEASRMQASSWDETLMDSDTLQQLVSPVSVEMEPEAYAEYSQRELLYHMALSQDPDNVLLLSNFAQFLFLVLHDHDRAEYYFKRAAGAKPGDPEALCRYANFLWQANKDIEGAEEAYLEAIAADPSNAHYAASYAHFLWNTGGEDTCYPLDGSDAC